jgi:hypothetical protein
MERAVDPHEFHATPTISSRAKDCDRLPRKRPGSAWRVVEVEAGADAEAGEQPLRTTMKPRNTPNASITGAEYRVVDAYSFR